MAANAARKPRERFAILIDHIVIMAAGLSDEAIQAGGIKGGSAQIAGEYGEVEARSIADAVLYPLDHAVEIVAPGSIQGLRGKDAKH